MRKNRFLLFVFLVFLFGCSGGGEFDSHVKIYNNSNSDLSKISVVVGDYSSFFGGLSDTKYKEHSFVKQSIVGNGVISYKSLSGEDYSIDFVVEDVIPNEFNGNANLTLRINPDHSLSVDLDLDAE